MRTERLIQLAIKTPFSLYTLEQVKWQFNLTDYGVKQLIVTAISRGIDLFDAAELSGHSRDGFRNFYKWDIYANLTNF